MYIGIIGNDAAMKDRLAYIYGKTIDWILRHPKEQSPSFTYITEYLGWCEEPINLRESSLRYIYFASFSHPLLVIISLFTEIPFTDLVDPVIKHDRIINLSTFKTKPNDGTERLIDPQDLYAKMDISGFSNAPDVWLTLNDFIIYFGYYMCRNYLGMDIWTTVERVSNENHDQSGQVRIYPDIKTISEYDYIKKEKKGIVIRADVKGKNKKTITDDALKNVATDIIYNNSKDIRGQYEDIYKMCRELVKSDWAWKNWLD